MLCTLSIAQWSASKHDRQASEEIAAHTAVAEKANRRRLRNIGSHVGKHAVAGQLSLFLKVETSIAHSND